MADNPEGLPARRQWGRLAVGLSIALLGGWLFAALYLSAGSRESVVVLARDVQAFQPLTEDDLTTERVAAGERVHTIDADQIENLTGHALRVTLTEGTVLTQSHIIENRNLVIPEGNDIAGFYLSRGEAPADLRAGDPVRVVVIPSDDAEVDLDELEGVCGWLAEVGRMDERTGNRKVDVVVPADQAAAIEAASTNGEVGLTRRSSPSDDTACAAMALGWEDLSASPDTDGDTGIESDEDGG